MLLDERFVHAWPGNQRSNAWLAEGGYRLASSTPGEFVALRAPLAEVPSDVVVSGTFRKVGGPAGGGYGLIVADQRVSAGDGKDQSGQFVVAAVGDRGEVGVWRRNGERWIDLLPWTASRAVRTGTNANELTVQLLGDHFTFLVNGEMVANLGGVTAIGLPPGGVGIFTGGDLNEVVVSRFRVQAPVPSANSHLAPDPPAHPDVQRIGDLLAGIAEDVGAIANSFAGGLDNPHDPVTDPSVLKQDQARVAAATTKATRLLAELQRVQNGALGGR